VALSNAKPGQEAEWHRTSRVVPRGYRIGAKQLRSLLISMPQPFLPVEMAFRTSLL
jgi:hypothetical protein